MCYLYQANDWHFTRVKRKRKEIFIKCCCALSLLRSHFTIFIRFSFIIQIERINCAHQYYAIFFINRKMRKHYFQAISKFYDQQIFVSFDFLVHSVRILCGASPRIDEILSFSFEKSKQCDGDTFRVFFLIYF